MITLLTITSRIYPTIWCLLIVKIWLQMHFTGKFRILIYSSGNGTRRTSQARYHSTHKMEDLTSSQRHLFLQSRFRRRSSLRVEIATSLNQYNHRGQRFESRTIRRKFMTCLIRQCEYRMARPTNRLGHSQRMRANSPQWTCPRQTELKTLGSMSVGCLLPTRSTHWTAQVASDLRCSYRTNFVASDLMKSKSVATLFKKITRRQSWALESR